MSIRPQSAFRARPQSGRARPAPASVPQNHTTEAAVEAEADEDYWLFSSSYRLTTADIALAGFTAVVLLDAARWRGGAELSPEACAAAELAYTFGFDDSLVPAVTSGHAAELISALEKCFAGRGGDLLIVFQNVSPGTELVERDQASTVVARVVDAISSAYSSADDKETPDLAGISVVLEGYARTGLQTLEGSWDDGSTVCLEVLPFADALPPA